MKKLLTILCALSLFALIGCGKSNGDSSSKTVSVPESKDLFSFQAVIDDNQYTFPTDFSTLEKNGWGLDEANKDGNLDSKSTVKTTLLNGDKKLLIFLRNSTDSKKPKNECEVVGLITNLSYSGYSVVLPGGITMDSTKDDIIKAYGDPTNTTSEGDQKALIYWKEKNKSGVQFDTYKETGKIADITILG